MLQRGLNLTDGEVDALLAAVLRMAQSRRDAMLPQRGGLAPLVRVVNVHKPVEATLKYLVAYWPALAAARRVIGYLARHDAAAYHVMQYRLWYAPPLSWRDVAARMGWASHKSAMAAMGRAREITRALLTEDGARELERWEEVG